jgi:hypothetical protein
MPPGNVAISRRKPRGFASGAPVHPAERRMDAISMAEPASPDESGIRQQNGSPVFRSAPLAKCTFSGKCPHRYCDSVECIVTRCLRASPCIFVPALCECLARMLSLPSGKPLQGSETAKKVTSKDVPYVLRRHVNFCRLYTSNTVSWGGELKPPSTPLVKAGSSVLSRNCSQLFLES